VDQEPAPHHQARLSAQADIYTGSRDQALALPIQSLVTREIKPKPGEVLKPGAPRDEEGVWLFSAKGKTQFMAVKTGLLGISMWRCWTD